jgi:hypothetical protein
VYITHVAQTLDLSMQGMYPLNLISIISTSKPGSMT